METQSPKTGTVDVLVTGFPVAALEQLQRLLTSETGVVGKGPALRWAALRYLADREDSHER